MDEHALITKIFSEQKFATGGVYLINCKLCDTPMTYNIRDQMNYNFPTHLFSCTRKIFNNKSDNCSYWVYNYFDKSISNSYDYRRAGIPSFTITKHLYVYESVDFNYWCQVYDLKPRLRLSGREKYILSVFDIVWSPADNKNSPKTARDQACEYLLKFCSVIECLLCGMEYSSPPDGEIIYAHLAKCKGLKRKF